VRFELVPFDQVDWASLDRFADRTFSQRRGWLEFVAETQAGRPVVASLLDGNAILGAFTGVIVRRLGVPIMGSPFPGWTTPWLGFNLDPAVPRSDAVRALVPFVFRELRCWHLELADPLLNRPDLAPRGFEIHAGSTFVSDLRLEEAALFGGMDSAARRAIRKAEKSGVSVEVAAPDGFGAEFHDQLTDVFAKQSLRPTYDRARVEALIRHVHGSGDLLLLRARDPDGRSIATGIFPGFGSRSHFWGNGSLREFQILRPNEALHWRALREWRARGVVEHHWGGGGAYKAKYGGQPVETLHARLSRFAVIGLGRELARRVYDVPRGVRRRRHLDRVGRPE
jgi:hypothetical protein